MILQFKGLSGSTIRSHNRSVLLRLFREMGPVSRNDLSGITQLTAPTVHSLVKELMAEGIVEDLGTTDPQGGGAGRRPSLLGLRPRSRLSLAVDISVKGTKLGIIGLRGGILGDIEIQHTDLANPKQVMDEIGHGLKTLLGITELHPNEPFVGIGVGVPGLVQVSTGTVLHSPNLGWRNVQFGDWLKRQFGLPVVIDNNARAMALGEQLFGIGRQAPNAITFFAGHGVGAGIVVNSRLYRGLNGGAGEVGHTTVNPDGPICRCGRRGCLDAVASEPAVIGQVQEALAQGAEPQLQEQIARLGYQTSGLSIGHIVQFAREGSPLCQSVLSRAATTLGQAAVNLINLLNPDMIITGGALFRYEDLWEKFASVVRGGAYAGLNEAVALERTQFGQLQGLMGAAALVLDEFLYAPDIIQTPFTYTAAEDESAS